MAPRVITSFTGQYRFLSNFSAARFSYALHEWPTAEHAFQASKASNAFDYQMVRSQDTGAAAKKAGRRVVCRADWEDIKRRIMLEILLAKFSQNGELRYRLISTERAALVEGNTWGDDYWGAIRGAIGQPVSDNAGPLPVWAAGPADQSYVLYGHNWLGRLLMMTREVL